MKRQEKRVSDKLAIISSHKLDKNMPVDFLGDLLARFGRVLVTRSCDCDTVAEEVAAASPTCHHWVSTGA